MMDTQSYSSLRFSVPGLAGTHRCSTDTLSLSRTIMPPKGSRSRRGGTASSKDEAAAAASAASSSGGDAVGGMGVVATTIRVPPTMPTTAAAAAAAKAEESEKKGDETSIVMNYLRKYGLVDAANELQTLLLEDVRKRKRCSSSSNDNDNTNDNDINTTTTLPPIDYDISDLQQQQSNTNVNNTLSQATGGGYGYDLDAAPTIALWGVGYAPPLLSISRRRSSTTTSTIGSGVGSTIVNSELLHQGRELDKLLLLQSQSSTADQNDYVVDNKEAAAISSFRDEARRYIMGYTCLITWILSLADDPPGGGGGDGASNPTATKTRGDFRLVGGGDVDDIGVNEGKGSLLSSIVASAIASSSSSSYHAAALLSPSCKSELLSLSFPLLVHTYCELLTSGLDHTALALLDTYRQLYEGSHILQLADLDNCTTTSRIVELNDDVVLQSVLHNEMRLLKTQIVLLAKKIEEVESIRLGLYNKGNKMRSPNEEKLLQEHSTRVIKYNDTLAQSQKKLVELASKNDTLTSKLQTLPFLRRARTLKWNITISTSTFMALSAYITSRDELLPMSALLQSRCHLIVGQRDPTPYCPPAVLMLEEEEEIENDGIVVGDRVSAIIENPTKLFMRDGSSSKTAVDTRSIVEFNRALLVNGFRRLEALELKQDYESGLLLPSPSSGDASGRKFHLADALQPSVMLATISSSSSSTTITSHHRRVHTTDNSFVDFTPWSDPNVGIASASICPPDGRKVAVGCDDAAVRIWSTNRSNKENESSLGEPSLVLLGHKNGLPVFDVDWTRNGRMLLSAGGDGTVRLWDTQAVGPYGKVFHHGSSSSTQKLHRKKGGTSVSQHHTIGGPTSTSLFPTVDVPGSKAELLTEVGGAALSVYRGHAPSTPIWCVSSAPCGYYFATAGSDYTARIWTTDHTTPVRVLCGHVSPSVNCITWHPNCNYVITASDDKTCRMFDIQTGQCVRLLSGSSRGLNMVRVSPSGKYAAGSGYDGVVRIWDLGNGRLVNELSCINDETHASKSSHYSRGMINAMSFSPCGGALAVAGEDCTVRIWDVSGASRKGCEIFKTNNVSICDLKYTKRNLLLAVGDYDKH